MNKSKLRLHFGRALKVVADTYPTLFLAILEAIQNALDAKPKTVWVNINFKTRHASVQDNGEGISKQRFDQTLANLLVSQKQVGQLGQFGMGLVAGFGKCESFAFTSCPSPNLNGYRTWTFDKSMLEESETDGVPWKPRTFKFDAAAENTAGRNRVPWRSMIQFFNFTQDNELSKVTLTGLCQEILGRFGTAMKQHGTTVLVTLTDVNGESTNRTLTAEDFQGTPLPEVTIEKPGYGKTNFRLFIANRYQGKRKGRVHVRATNDVYRVSFGDLARVGTLRQWLDQDIIEALLSGFFEGEIEGNLVLHKGRRSFEENDAWVDFTITLTTWWKDFGKQVYDEAQTEDKAERYTRVGLTSLQEIEQLYHSSEFAEVLHRAIESFQFGSIGQGHAAVSRKTVSEVAGTQTKGGARPGTGRHQSNEPATERKDHTPFVVQSESGSKRRVVKSNSLGLVVEFDELPGERLAWELDKKLGVVRINIRHPLWGKCEKTERFLSAYIVKVTLYALVSAAATPEMRPTVEQTFQITLGLQVDHMIATDKWTRRSKTATK